RRFERQQMDAVAAGALGKKDEIVAVVEPALDFVALARRTGAVGALDEDGTLQFRQPAEDRPARDFGLGDEAAVDPRAHDLDIEIGGVVGDEERRAMRRARAAADETNAE